MQLDTLQRNVVRLRAVIELAELFERGDFPHLQSKDTFLL